MTNIKRRFVISALLVMPALSAEAETILPTDKTDMARVSTYLDGLTTMKARFSQLSPEGVSTSGTMLLSRPGRIRFQYDPPSPYLLVAGFGQVSFHDKELNQTTTVPASSTPLGILLEQHVTFDRDIKVSSLTREDGKIFVKLFRPKAVEDGALTLILNAEPLELLGWVVTDDQKQNTRVSLSNIELGGKFSDDLFKFEDPRLKNSRNN